MFALERAVAAAVTHVVHYAASMEFFVTFPRRAELFLALCSAFNAACGDAVEVDACPACAWDASDPTDVHANERHAVVRAIGVDGHACLAVTTSVSKLCEAFHDRLDQVCAQS